LRGLAQYSEVFTTEAQRTGRETKGYLCALCVSVVSLRVVDLKAIVPRMRVCSDGCP